jgi:hypothetical protein
MTATNLTRPDAASWSDLAPMILRQRLIIEGRCAAPIDGRTIENYLIDLTTVCGMTTLTDPVVHRSERYGWAGWIHWETSGAHVYAWEQPVLFFSVDLYTCKAFDPLPAVELTRQRLRAIEIVSREV